MGKQAPKMSARVVNAIRNLREAHGSTSKEIMSYIMSQCNVPETTVQRQMQAALRRGLDYGILKKNNGHYFLNTEAEPQMVSALAPAERSRRRRSRRRRSRRRRGRRRRSRGRRSRRRRSRRSRRRRRSSTMRARRIGCTRCRCTKKTREVNVLKNNPIEQQIQEEELCTCDKEHNMESRYRQAKAATHSVSRSRSLANSDRDCSMDDRRPIDDQD